MARNNAVLGFLTRLRRDVRGNTLAIVAAAIIPLIGMVGGAVDLSRLYLTRVRLQHACDAGALAGRKQMGGGAWSTTAQASANQFFWANFKQNAYGTGTATVTFTSSGTDVHGTASTTVPMTLMSIFSAPTRTIDVSCDSQMQLPNTDVMFVLDNTGSMACLPDGSNCNSGSSSKIAVLRHAVKCFYESLSQLDIPSETCTPAPTGGGINSSSQLRFGFVPYSVNVNVSNLDLPSNYFADSWPYQSRVWDTNASHNVSDSEPYPYSQYGYSKDPCRNNTTPTKPSSATFTVTNPGRSNCQTLMTTTGPRWIYAQQTLDVSGFKNSNTAGLPIGPNGGTLSVTWNGCVEEWLPTSNINAIPSSSDWRTQYARILPQAIFARAAWGSLNTSQMTRDTYKATGDVYNGITAYCPAPAKKLKDTTYWTPSVFNSYVNSLTPTGNTYHDIGMLWGGRLISPEGMFQSENAQTASGGQIMRHVIFMTDGDAQAGPCDYSTYGVAWYDQRATVPTRSCSTSEDQTLDDGVNSRLTALCAAVKHEPNTTLWVISFGGTGIASDTKTRLQGCATDANHYFDATSATQLNSAFQMIAAQITQLRLTQ